MGNCYSENEKGQTETDLSQRPQVFNANLQPECPQRAPYQVDMKQGETYYYCTCGKSKNQPFCDGSHEGSAFNPKPFTWDKEDGKAYLCGCKHTKNAPFCDGTHNNQIDW